MDNVQKVNYCINEPSSQTFRCYLHFMDYNTSLTVEEWVLQKSFHNEIPKNTGLGAKIVTVNY
jgi:hypothetical protein